MTITANETYNVLTVQSDSLKDFTNIASVVLKATINCSTTEYTDTIVEGDVTLATGVFEMDLDALFSTTTPADGVYTFTLVITYDNTTVVNEFSCLFIDNETRCAVAECVKTTELLELATDYYILSRVGDGSCGCDCQTLCNIYERVINGISNCKGC